MIGNLIQLLALQENKVFLLFDEYDDPILNNLTENNTKKATKIRDALAAFFKKIKDCSDYIEFVFITGVTRFSRTSIFSGFNNLIDLTLDERAAALLGYTDEEIDSLSYYTQQLTQERALTFTQAREELRSWYNGYRFTSKNVKVYNPFSILNCFDLKKFSNY
jgi:hypothetical protein